jgi:hypothetical protein
MRVAIAVRSNSARRSSCIATRIDHADKLLHTAA